MKSIFFQYSKRVFMLVLLLTGTVYASYAAGDATQAFTSIVTNLKSIFTSLTTVLYAVSALIGIIGAVQVYQKWSSGDPNTNKIAASWFGAAIFVSLVATFLKAMFIS
jgi:hypothetical protein